MSASNAGQRAIAGKLLFTTGEAASLLGMSRSRLYQLLAAGSIDSVSIGRSRRIPAPALWEYVERLRAVDSGSPAAS